MKAYILCFIITFISAIIAQESLKKENKKIAFLASFITIFVPSFIAGVRSEGVGRDINNYVAPVINRVMASSNFFDFSSRANFVELGYRIFMYVIVRINSNLEFSLFFIQLIPCSCVYYFAYKNRQKLNMGLVMATYLLWWYPRSYTIMRQSISVGFVLVGILKYNEKKYYTSFSFFLLAILFHNSAFLALPILILLKLYNTEKMNKKYKFTLFFLIIMGILVATISYEKILYILAINYGKIFEKYYNYLNSEFANESIVASVSEILYRIVCFVLGIFFIINTNVKYTNKKDEDFSFYFILLLIEMVLYLIALKMSNGERIGYYYRYIGMLYCIPSFVNIFKKDALNMVISYSVVISIMFVFWFYTYPIQEKCETYPYKSTVVTWLN